MCNLWHILKWLIDWFLVFNAIFQQYYSYIMATSFSGGRSRSTRTEPPTMCNLQSRARTHAVLVIGLHELLGNQTTESLSHLGPGII